MQGAAFRGCTCHSQAPWVAGVPGSLSRSGKLRQRPGSRRRLRVRAAVSDADTDLGAILKDALQSSGIDTTSPSVASAAQKAARQAAGTASTQGSGLKAGASPATQAGSQAAQSAAGSPTQAASSTAAQGSGSAAQSATGGSDAASNAAQAASKAVQSASKSAAPPASPDAGSSALQSAGDATSSAQEAASSAAPDADRFGSMLRDLKQQAANTTQSVGPKPRQDGQGFFSGFKSQLQQAQDSAQQQLSAAKQGLRAPAGGDGAPSPQAGPGPAESTQGLLTSVQSGLQGALEQGRQAVGSVQQAGSEAFEDVSSAFDSATGGLSSSAGQALQTVEQTAQQGLYAASAQVQSATSSALNALPPEVSDALRNAGSAVRPLTGRAAQAIQSDARLSAAAVVVLVGLPLLAGLRSAGAFGDKIAPDTAFKALQEDNVVLVDIRTDDQRLREGTLELKRGARSKAVSLQLPELAPGLRRQIRKPSDVLYSVWAAQVAGLSQIKFRTRVIVMDQSEGASARELAKAIGRTTGLRAAVLRGGFRAWAQAGLGVRPSVAEYSSSIFETLEDEFEVAVSTASGVLSDPFNFLLSVAGITFVGWTLYDYHSTLRFIAVIGLFTTAVSVVTGYESAEAFAEDTGTVFSKAAALVPSGGTRSISAGSNTAEEEDEEAEEQELAYAGAPAGSSSGTEEDQAAPASTTQRIQAKPEPATSGTQRISRESSAEKSDQAATQAAMDE